MQMNVKLVAVLSAVLGLIVLQGCGMKESSQASSAVGIGGSTYTISGTVEMPNGVAATPLAGAKPAAAKPATATPISGATVYLYAAGTSGYGSAATLLAMTTTGTSGGGTFNFIQNSAHVNSLSSITNTYSCPSYTFSSADGTTSITKDSFIYVVGVGGDTQDGTGSAHSNTGAVLIAALGDCQQLALNEPFVVVNSVTTIASVFSLASYISPIYPTATINGSSKTLVGGALGTSTAYQTGWGSAVNGGYTSTGTKKSVATTPMGYQGLANAFGTVPLLVNLNIGTAVASFTTANASLGPSGVVLTGTPEQAKLNHLGDILAYCIDSSNSGATLSTQCSTLFGLAVPPISSSTTSLGTVTFPAATDTLQASYYLATNPTNNTSNGTPTAGSSTNLGQLYSLASANTDFQPTLTAQPSDWTVSIAYTSTSTCGTDAIPGSFFGTNPWWVASDISGNIALMNGEAVTASGNGSALVQITPAGVPSSCQLGDVGVGRVALYDVDGDLWTMGGGNLYESVNPATAPLLWQSTDGTNQFNAVSMTADGKGNVFYFDATSGSLERFAGAQGSTSQTTSAIAGSAVSSPPANVYSLGADTAGNIFGANNSVRNSILAFAALTNGSYVDNTLNNSALYYPYGISIDAKGTLISANSCCSTTSSYHVNAPYRVTYTFSPTTGAESQDVNTFTTNNEGGLQDSRATAIDGAGNIWLASLTASQSYTDPVSGNAYGIWQATEFNTALAPLSPNGTVAFSSACTNSPTTTGCNLGGGYSKTSMGAARMVAIDISGNVWYPADQSANTASAGPAMAISSRSWAPGYRLWSRLPCSCGTAK